MLEHYSESLLSTACLLAATLDRPRFSPSRLDRSISHIIGSVAHSNRFHLDYLGRRLILHCHLKRIQDMASSSTTAVRFAFHTGDFLYFVLLAPLTHARILI
jgi:hypothetical protein